MSYSPSLFSLFSSLSPSSKPYFHHSPISCCPRDSRPPLLCGHILSSEAILAIQALKRSSSSSSTDLHPLFCRLIKLDLLVALCKLLHQNPYLLALTLFSTTRRAREPDQRFCSLAHGAAAQAAAPSFSDDTQRRRLRQRQHRIDGNPIILFTGSITGSSLPFLQRWRSPCAGNLLLVRRPEDGSSDLLFGAIAAGISGSLCWLRFLHDDESSNAQRQRRSAAATVSDGLVDCTMYKCR
ncbi:hypothetical protein MRB53_028006 [Persea americana]|uniref:Uncharacterized protein n=1 Tax=Persea americana TaxID=3435 RepID=A0ACC2KEN2_PERAE|nr:hypothetical protein MRB53_028006 [Persea americana]